MGVLGTVPERDVERGRIGVCVIATGALAFGVFDAIGAGGVGGVGGFGVDSVFFVLGGRGCGDGGGANTCGGAWAVAGDGLRSKSCSPRSLFLFSCSSSESLFLQAARSALGNSDVETTPTYVISSAARSSALGLVPSA